MTVAAAADIDNATLTFAIAGGADAARFVIDAVTGALSFIAAPDFEAPGDAGGDNVYDVIVQAFDGSLTDTQAIAVTVTNVGGVTIEGTSGDDTVNRSETVAGQPAPTGEEDIIRGNDGNDALVGVGGNDELFGGARNDKLFGSRGDDDLRGGADDDHLRGGAGKDFLNGGAGIDTASFADRPGPIAIVLKGTAEALVRVNGVVEDTLKAIENVVGGDFADVLTGDAFANRLVGNDGDDRLKGAAGDDLLVGRLGRDVMTGGADADSFRFLSLAEMGKTATTRDRITDFRHGTDDVDLAAIDANGSAAGHRFTFLTIEGEGFNSVRGELRWFQVDAAGVTNDKTIVAGDINGDGVADFQIELAGLKNLAAADFLL